MDIRLRPIQVEDLELFRRIALVPGLVGPNWYGFRDPEASRRRFETDNFLGPDDSRLAIEIGRPTTSSLGADSETGSEVAGSPDPAGPVMVGFVGWHARSVGPTRYWEIGIS